MFIKVQICIQSDLVVQKISTCYLVDCSVNAPDTRAGVNACFPGGGAGR